MRFWPMWMLSAAVALAAINSELDQMLSTIAAPVIKCLRQMTRAQ